MIIKSSGLRAFIRLAIIGFLGVNISCNQSSQPYGADKDWVNYQGDLNGSQYSKLDQINTKNVQNLEVAWSYHTGDSTKRSQIQCNPLIIDGVLYGTTPRLKLFALNAATGDEIWRFDPFAKDSVVSSLSVNRGVSYWSGGGDQRILYAAGANLYEIDAKTGKPVETFGDHGQKSLKDGLDGHFSRNVEDLYVASTTPGRIYKDLLIIGTRVSEGPDAAPGYIRAYDVHTGEIRWTFHTIPQPGEFGYDTWPKEAYKTVGGANSWSGMSLDKEKGIVYIPLGSASFDFYGGNRIGQDLFANCLLALNAETGKRVWHYQTVHHDIWDRDLPTVPNLVTVKHDGEMVDAVAQITKQGFIFLLDRNTGEPLFPVEEKPVAESTIPGEKTWPTQPFPTKPKPFARSKFEPTNISPEAHQFAVDSLKNLKTGPLFTPPSLQGTLLFPGYDGGGEWGGAAFDPHTGILYVNANNIGWLLQLAPVKQAHNGKLTGKSVFLTHCAVCHGRDLKGDPNSDFPSLVNIKDSLDRKQVIQKINTGGGFMPSFSHLSNEQKNLLVDYLFQETHETKNLASNQDQKEVVSGENQLPYAHTGYKKFLDPDGYPANKPPWGTLSAIDLNQGKILWQKPLGEYEELTKKGIHQTGTQNYGGPVVTDGGVIFIAATSDEKFRAFDKKTGEVLWETDLPAAGYATPSTYRVNGQQYVVIACGGGKLGTKSGDTYMAFRLPD